MPACNGTEQRLDALIVRVDRIVALLFPEPPASGDDESDTIEMREPDQPATRPNRAKS